MKAAHTVIGAHYYRYMYVTHLEVIFCRDHSDWMLKELNNYDVPLLIFSAGLGDIIEEVIRQHYTMYSNMKIVSNYMDFNNQVHLTTL